MMKRLSIEKKSIDKNFEKLLTNKSNREQKERYKYGMVTHKERIYIRTRQRQVKHILSIF